MASIKFNGNASEFYTDLRSRVDAYFAEKKIDPTGNGKLYFKTAFYMLSFLTVYITLVFLTPTNWVAILLCILFGLLTAGIGFNVMHDGGHGSYSPNKTVNKLAAPLGQAATQAPQPMHSAESIAASATGLGTGMRFASGAPPVGAVIKPPASIIRSNADRSTIKSLIIGNDAARHGSITIVALFSKDLICN